MTQDMKFSRTAHCIRFIQRGKKAAYFRRRRSGLGAAGAVTLRVPQTAFGVLTPFGAQLSSGDPLAPGGSATVTASIPLSDGAQLLTVVQRDFYADDSQNTWQKQEVLTVAAVPLEKIGGELGSAQAQVALPQELETKHASGRMASCVSIRAYVWNGDMAPFAPAGIWQADSAG